jgi:cytochrome c peroxidase
MKRRTTICALLCVMSGTLIFYSCKKYDTPHSQAAPVEFKVPQGWPQPTYNFTNNPLTQEGIDLGKKLFYDGRLSKDGNFPCASCHQQFAAFSTFDHNLSHGFNNQFTKRNAPALFNLAWHTEMHWDGAINNIEVQPLAPITAPNEMAEDINHVLQKLAADSGYKRMFKAAFGDETINSQRMLYAITQFVLTLVSSNSKYDKVQRGEMQFTDIEEKGYEIFKANCSTCHKEPLFTDLSFRNNGLDVNPTINDIGRMDITHLSSDSLKFKVPSLRNLMLTFPYMHDGRIESPLEALDHYTDGIVQSPTLDPLLRKGLPITTSDKLYLLEFLRTLTDSTFVNDPKFAQPQ